jgi:hypothetical protein
MSRVIGRLPPDCLDLLAFGVGAIELFSVRFPNFTSRARSGGRGCNVACLLGIVPDAAFSAGGETIEP